MRSGARGLPRRYYCLMPHGKPDFAAISGPVLAHFQTADAFITVDDAQAREAELRGAGVDVSVEFYEGAGHACSDEANRLGTYDPEVAERSWTRTLAFLHEHLADVWPGASQAACRAASSSATRSSWMTTVPTFAGISSSYFRRQIAAAALRASRSTPRLESAVTDTITSRDSGAGLVGSALSNTCTSKRFSVISRSGRCRVDARLDRARATRAARLRAHVRCTGGRTSSASTVPCE